MSRTFRTRPFHLIRYIDEGPRSAWFHGYDGGRHSCLYEGINWWKEDVRSGNSRRHYKRELRRFRRRMEKSISDTI